MQGNFTEIERITVEIYRFEESKIAILSRFEAWGVAGQDVFIPIGVNYQMLEHANKPSFYDDFPKYFRVPTMKEKAEVDKWRRIIGFLS